MATALTPTDIDARLERFTAHVEPLGATIVRLKSSHEVTEFIAEVAIDSSAERVVVSSELASAAPEMAAAGTTWHVPKTVDETRDQPLGVSLATLAIAETGSVMLAEQTLEDRAVGLLTRTHITVVQTGNLVPSLADGAAAMREVALRPGGGYGSFVTGPSRTADIEMSLTVGVQGPARVYIIFVDELV